MAIEITNDTSVALVDSVTGIAFGPTFESSTEADDFLEWYNNSGFDADLRVLSFSQFREMVVTWQAERVKS